MHAIVSRIFIHAAAVGHDGNLGIANRISILAYYLAHDHLIILVHRPVRGIIVLVVLMVFIIVIIVMVLCLGNGKSQP
jgi:hypothetical protein